MELYVVDIRYNYFYKNKHHFVIGSTCAINIDLDLERLKEKREFTQEEQSAIKNWERMRKKAIHDRKILNNTKNPAFVDCIVCNLRLVRKYCDLKKGETEEDLNEKKYKDKRRLEVCDNCLEKNVMNCDTCEKEMCIQLRNDEVQKKCNNCIKKKYQKDYNPCIICDRYCLEKPSRETICEKCISDNKKICCRGGCQKKIKLELDLRYGRPKLYCKNCYFDRNGEQNTKIFWKEYYT